MADFHVRPAVEADRLALSKLVHYEMRVHRHLDWRAPIDWIGWSPFLVAEIKEEIVAALACPMDLPRVAWIRLFAVMDDVDDLDAWKCLWEKARCDLSNEGGCTAAAIPLAGWMADLLNQSGFSHSNDVIILKWESGMRMPEPLSKLYPRKMRIDDLLAVHRVDSLSFQPLWQNSLISLEMAYEQAAVATVVEEDSRIIGYQISTASHMGGHIARLAVLPEMQGRNIGYALVYDCLRQFERRMIFQVTVNTQRDNLVSQRLYLKAGFSRTGESYQVFQEEKAC